MGTVVACEDTEVECGALEAACTVEVTMEAAGEFRCRREPQLDWLHL